MAWLDTNDRAFLETLSKLTYCNQFLPERVELERQALGNAFDQSDAVWSKSDEIDGERANVKRLNERAEGLATKLREQLARGSDASETELLLYEDLVQYVLYYRFRNTLRDAVTSEAQKKPSKASQEVASWDDFVDEFHFYLSLGERRFPSQLDPAHLFADFFQIRRAFHHIYYFIVGRSMPAARLRAAVWQSVFTHDMRRYRRTLYGRMGDFTTLIAGGSGTGKELVARAVGLSRYIPFDVAKRQFEEDFSTSFYPLNLSALSPTLIESELFGHCRGAFTGAVGDRQGWLETCSRLGTVFLDEIGELDPAIQVKLLRVLQSRVFQRLGEVQERKFRGKIIAATNRDLALEIKEGRFRADFYYRLCSDLISTPSLAEQLADAPDDLHNLVLHIAGQLAGEEAASVAAEVEVWIEANLGGDYPWPGNIRELEQCVRNVMIHNRYTPPERVEREIADEPCQRLLTLVEQGALTAEDLLRQYCTMVYARLGSYEQTAKQLGLDRRTVKAKIDKDLLEELK